MTPGFRRAAAAVASLNLAWFGVEFAAARATGSVALFADSIDFLEDAALNILVLAAAGWSLAARAQLGTALAAILLVPTIAAFAAAWQQWSETAAPPPAEALTLIGAGALAVNLACATLLARHRCASGSLSRAAFLSSRNDALANVAIITAGFVTGATGSRWPDLGVGLGIAALNAGAAREVFLAARAEARAAQRV